MGLLQSIRHWMFAGACLLAGVPLLFCIGAWAGTSPGLRRLFRALGDRFRSLAPSVRAALSALLAVATLHGVPKVPPGSNAPSSGPPPAGMVSGGLPARPARGPSSGPRLTAGQYRAGFALARVATNPSPALASVPSNAVVHAPWARYGVAEDTFWLPATNWSFTLGTNRVGGLHVSSSGTLSFGWPKGSPRARRMPDGSGLDFLAPLQTSLGIVPPAGRFWHAPTASNSLLLAWQDVFAGRDAGLPVTFQAELFPSGDFVYRYDLSRLSATNALPATNWVVGAQHGGGGETFAFGGTGVLVHGLELHWRAFGMLDPDIADHDGDGLSTYDEVMVHGTDPRLPDTDLDGLADPDELALGTGPRNPDADGDGLPDGIDPEPFAWNDPDADADGDGCPLWQELLHGTSDAVPGDVARLLADGFRTVVFTVAGTPGPGTVLALGGRPLLLEGREEFSLDLPDGSSIPLALGNAPGVSVSAASTGCIVLAGRTGGLAPGGKGAGAATLVLPAVTVGSGGIVCLHDAHQPIVASVTDGLPGTYNWEWINGAIYGGRSPVISPSWILPGRLTVRFLPDDGNGVGCGTSAMVEQCHRFYCDHGRPARECGICTGGSPEEWCSLHGEWKCVCACLTLGGGGMLAPGGEAGFMLGSENDGCMRHIHHARCCACPGHMALGGWWAEKKTNVVRRISARLDVRRDGVPVAAGDRFAGPAPLTAGGLVPSTAFGDAQVVASHELHPSHTATSSWTVAAIGLDAAGTAGGHCRIRGGTGCVSRVAVLTESALAEGSLRLAASAGLRFSVVEGAPWAAARSALTNTPPASVAASRDFWLSAQVGGDYELGYKLLDPAQRVRLSTNLLVEAIVARLATNAYYTACGSTAGITVNLAPSSHDPEGYTLRLDGTPIADGQPPWPVSVSNLAAGAHSLTLQSNTFPDLADEATLYVVRVDSVEPDSMANLQEIDDGDGNSRTRVFVVPVEQALEFPSTPVTVRANLVPTISESQLPAGWTIEGGTGSGKLTRIIWRYVSTGASKTEFTFSCGGTDSGFKTTVYVYDARVALFADEGDLQNLEVGHSWGRYSIDDDTCTDLIDSDYWDYFQEIGFWPSIAGNADCAGDVRLGGDAVGAHLPTGWKEYPISLIPLLLALPQVKASDDAPPWYNLFNYNCTDYAIGIGEAVNIYTMDASGLSTPWAFSGWLNAH
jgi:hypothetical protein